MFTNANLYLGRTEYLFSLDDLHQVAVTLSLNIHKPSPSREAFLKKVATSLSRVANVEGGSPVNYVYHEASDSHFTNFPGLLLTLSYCPPNIRVKFTEAISHAIALPRADLDASRRSIAIEQARAGDWCLATEEVAIKILQDPDNVVSILEKYTEEQRNGQVQSKVEEPLVEVDDSESRGVPEGTDA